MSIEKGKITGLQLVFLLTALIQGTILQVVFIANLAKQDSSLVAISGLAATIPFALSYAALAKRFPEMNLVQMNDAVYPADFFPCCTALRVCVCCLERD